MDAEVNFSSHPSHKLQFIRDQRKSLHDVIVSLIKGQNIEAESIKEINRGIRSATGILQVKEDSGALSMEWSFDQEDPVAFLHPIYQSLEKLLSNGAGNRIKECGECRWLFWEQTKSNTRKWCDMRYCGSRKKAREYYRRKRESETG